MKDEISRIMAAARTRFYDTGLECVSIESLAADTGLEMARVLELFPEKLAVMFSIILEELVAVAKSSMERLPEGPLDAQLKHLLRARFDFFMEHRHCVAEVMQEVLFVSGGWRGQYEMMLWRFSVEMVALVEAAKRRGEIRQDTNETLVARSVVSYYITGMLMGLRGDMLDADGVCDFTFPMIDALVASIK